MWVYSLYTMVDGMFVGHGVCPDALAGVNIVAPFVNLIFSIGVVFATGASTLISIELGKGHREQANNIFSTITLIAILISVFLALVTLFNLKSIISLLGAPEDVFLFSFQYLRIIVIFAVFLILSYFFELVVKVDGFPGLAIRGVLLSGIANIVLDYLFIMQFGWGVTGAALATGISQVAATLFYIFHFSRGHSNLQFVKPHMPREIVRKSIAIGLSAGIMEISSGLVTFIFNMVIGLKLGSDGLISFGVISYINQFVFMTVTGISQGTQPLISFYFGKSEQKAVSEVLHLGMIYVTAVGVMAFVICNVLTSPLVGLFLDIHDSLEVFTATLLPLRLFSLSFLFVGYNVLFASYFSSVTKIGESVAVTVLRGLVFALCSMAISILFLGNLGIWISQFICEMPTSMCIMIMLKRQPNWKHISQEREERKVPS
jgi:putative MATE family efflux protein